MPHTVLLIHGAWLNSVSWEKIKARYESRGHRVIAPDWPYDDRSPEELRTSPAPELAKVGQRDILAHYEKIIRDLDAPPLIIGHSAGGTFTQHLLDRGLGAAGVAIDPAPTPGVALYPHAIVSALPVFSDPFSWRKVKHMSRSFFANRFAQTAPRDQVDALYDRYIVPTPGKVYWDGVINTIKINWASKIRPPLLLIGGGKDLIADGAMTAAIYRKQKRAASPTELKIYSERSHWTCMDAGWEEVADYALDWAIAHAVSDTPAEPAQQREVETA